KSTYCLQMRGGQSLQPSAPIFYILARWPALDHEKFSISHTFRVPLDSHMASRRPSGDEVALQMSELLEWSRTVTLPSSVTFSRALSDGLLCQETKRLFPSGDQSALINPFHPFTTRSRVSPVEVERSWMVSWSG